jgi:pimeloyl-ACP methyl ester carboxylesterase
VTGAAVTYREAPVFLESGEDSLFAIVTVPARGRATAGLIVLPGGATPLTTNRNRLSVRICRALAREGYAAMRLDYHGTGDSTGVLDQIRLDQPVVEDVAAGVAYLRSIGVERVALAGSCYGARNALETAAALPEVSEVIMIAPSTLDYVLGERGGVNRAKKWSLGRYAIEALRPRTIAGVFSSRKRRSYGIYARAKMKEMRRKLPGRQADATGSEAEMDASPGFERAMRTLADRGAPVLFVYGGEDGFYGEFTRAADGRLGEILGGSTVSVRVLPGKIHGFTTVHAQDVALEEIRGWAARTRTDGSTEPIGEPEAVPALDLPDRAAEG